MVSKSLCKYCGSNFSTLYKLRAHRNRSTCKIFKYMSFSCEMCDYKSKDLKNIEDHILNHLEKNTNIIDVLNKKIKNLEEQLSDEKSKNNIVVENPKDITEKEKDEKVEEPKKDEKDSDNESKKKRVVYKTPKMELKDEGYNIKNLDQVTKDLEKENKTLWNISKGECLSNINTKLNLLKNSRNYTKILKEIKEQRLLLLRFLSIEEFTGYIHSHISEIKNILKSNKRIDLLIKTVVLSSLEMRLIYCEGFENTTLEVEEINFFKSCLNFKYGVCKSYIKFSKDYFLNEFLNYNISMFSLKENIELIVINKYGFNNLIYLPFSKSTLEDPYSFYYLEKINGDIRNWRMDCRLDEIITDFISVTLDYCINLYRKLYNFIFRDNTYRSEITIYNPIFESECQQLLENIILLASPKKIYRLFRDVIIEKNTYQPTKNDKFNLYSDDILQRRNFLKLISEDENQLIFEKLSRLFDNSDLSQMEEFYKKFNTINFKS